MYSFLVLGLVPGTNIQITFWGWIGAIAFVLLGHALYKYMTDQTPAPAIQPVRTRKQTAAKASTATPRRSAR